jgi:hypothetical protein
LAVARGDRHDRHIVRGRVFRCCLSVVALTLTSCAGAPHALFDAPKTPSSVADRAPHRSLDPITVDPPEHDPLAPDATLDPVATLDDALLHELSSAVVLDGGKSIGSTSIVLKLPLDGGAFAAFKPDTRRHRDRWRAEIAAWRLAHALKLEGVPPSVPRAVKLGTIMTSVASEKSRKKISQQVLVRDELVVGAMIAWLPNIHPLPLEREPMRTAWGEWLAQHGPSTPIEERVSSADAHDLETARPLMAQISAMIVFDQLTGNRDRWSGANVMVDETGTRLVFLDNNLAFDATIDREQTKKRAHTLARVERFSRSLVDAVRGLDRDAIAHVFSVDHQGAPLLRDDQIDAVMQRRAELLAHVDALIAKYGDERVLCFD